MELIEIKEMPENFSKSSEEEVDWKKEFENLQNEFNYLNEKHRETQAKIQSFSIQLEETSKTAAQGTAELLEKLVQEMKVIYKGSRHSRTSSFNIEGTLNLKISPKTRRKLLFDDIPLESDLNEELESLEIMKEESIKANKLILELKKKNRELEEELNKLSRAAQGTSFLEEVYKEENARLRQRNFELEQKIESIDRQEMMVSEYFKAEVPNALNYHRRIFEGFLRKVNYLEDKENRILAAYFEMKKKVDEEMIEQRKGLTFTLLLMILAAILAVAIYKVSSKVQYA